MRATILILSLVVVGACNRGAEEGQEPARSGSKPRAQQQARKAVYPENDALAILRALGESEVALSRTAGDVSQNGTVLGYASVVSQDHREFARLLDSALVQAGLTPRENAISGRIRRDGDSIAKALMSLPGGFNNTFIEEQVKAHQQALELLDTAIIPSVQQPQVGELVAALRPLMLAHLQRGMQILATRRKEAEERGEAWQSGFERVPVPPPEPAPTQPAATPPVKWDTLPLPPTSTSNM